MEYWRAVSKQSIAAPSTPQPIPKRACDRQPSGPFSPFAPGSIAESGTRQSTKARLDVTETRMDILPWISELVKPGVPFSTRNPRMPSSVRAHTTATSATDPLVIQVFSPFRFQQLPSFFARVSMPAGLEPKPGSVSPKHPMASPDCNFGSQCSFCSADPYVRIGYITSAPCTEAKLRSPESARSSSCITRPYSMLLMPAQP